MTKTISAGMESHLTKSTTTLSTCWKVVRKDGVTLGFTDHDKPLTIAGLVYIESSGYFRTAISNSSTSAVDNLDVEGFLDDASISEDDLRAGSYDYATVEVFIVNWANLADGIIPLRTGLFGETTIMSSGLFKVELRGLTQLFTAAVGDVYQPECRADFGDSECGVQNIAFQRNSFFPYKTGDRVLVPNLATGLNKAIQVKNGGFEIYPTDGHVTVTGGAAGSANNEIGSTGVADSFYSYYMTGRVGTYEDSFTASIGDSVELEFEVMQGPDWNNEKIKGQLRDRDGNLTETLDITPGAAWTTVNLTAVGDFQAGSGGKRWALIVSNSTTPGVPAPTACILIRNLTVVSQLSGDVTRNPGFLPYAAENNVSGVGNWTKDFFTMQSFFTRATPYLAPLVGTNMLSILPLVFGDAGITSDKIQIQAADVSNTKIDAGEYDLEIGVNAAASDLGGFFTIRISWFDASNILISKDTSINLSVTTKNLWKKLSAVFTPVSGARSFTITLKPHDGTAVYKKMYFDTIVARLYEPTFFTGGYERYAGREFEANNDGTTAVVPPVFNFTLGATTVDSGVTWTAIIPKYVPFGFITTVIDNLTFESVDLIGYDDNYFDWGIFEPLDGQNVPRKIEVDTFTKANGRVVLKLPMPYPLLVGGKFRLFAGCDKTREVCFSRFNNIERFRGEPDVPGTGQFFKVAGTR